MGACRTPKFGSFEDSGAITDVSLVPVVFSSVVTCFVPTTHPLATRYLNFEPFGRFHLGYSNDPTSLAAMVHNKAWIWLVPFLFSLRPSEDVSRVEKEGFPDCVATEHSPRRFKVCDKGILDYIANVLSRWWYLAIIPNPSIKCGVRDFELMTSGCRRENHPARFPRFPIGGERGPVRLKAGRHITNACLRLSRCILDFHVALSASPR